MMHVTQNQRLTKQLEHVMGQRAVENEAKEAAEVRILSDIHHNPDAIACTKNARAEAESRVVQIQQQLAAAEVNTCVVYSR
jgi:transcription elongation GreA/GreB family factor